MPEDKEVPIFEPYYWLYLEYKDNPTFKTARSLWIHCTENDLTVPEEVLKTYMEGVKKDERAYRTRKPNPIKRVIRETEKRQKIINAVEEYTAKFTGGGSKSPRQDAYERLAEELNIGSESVKRKYLRAKKKKK